MKIVKSMACLRISQASIFGKLAGAIFATLALLLGLQPAFATNFTRSVPGTSLQLPADYPQAGGVAFVLVGTNGNVYYQFSDPTDAFRGFNNSPNRPELGGNPFTINDPLTLDCGYSACRDYFGGGVANMYIRFSAYDGDTQVGGFDQNDISLLINGFNVGNWSNLTTQITNNDGTQGFGFVTGFGNNTFNTGWFQTSNQGLLENILNTGTTTTQVLDVDPNDNYWDFQRGPSLQNQDIVTVAPGYNISKSASTSSYTTVGQQVTYTYIIENIGSVPISDIEVDDDKITEQGEVVTCNKTTLKDRKFGAPQGPDTATCTGVYTITQADIDAGQVVNIAVASGTPEEGQLGEVSDTETINGPTQNPVIDLQKTTSLSNFGNAGTTVPYTFRVENTGNVTLTNVLVTDTRIPSLSCNFATLNVDQVRTCSGSYTVLQSDVDAFAASGTQLSNTATVTADPPTGASISENDTLNIPGSASNPDIDLTKVSLTPTFSAPGDTIDFRFDIRNTGNVTLSAATASVWPPVISDSLGIPVSCPNTSIGPGQTLSCSASYTVQQLDIDNGQIVNTASTSFTVGGQTVTDSGQATVPASRTTGIQMTKRVASGSPTTFTTVGQTISYEYEVRNTGTVTLNDVRVEDDKVTVSCPATPVAPNTTLVCTASYPVTQDDLNEGSVTNLATGFARPSSETNEIQSTQQSLTLNAVQTKSLEVAKSAGTPTPSFSVGSTIPYTFEVTNTGNVDLDGPFTVSDNKIGNFQCFTGTLLTGAANSQTCTANYTLTSNDVGAGFVTNTASVSGDGVTSPTDSATVSNTANPSVSLAKSASPSPVPAGTTTITYTFTVTNDGDAQLIKATSPITVNDPLIGAVDCTTPQPATLDPLDTFQCTASYTLNQTQINAGEVVNTATASFPFNTPSGTQTITSPSVTETTPIDEDPSFTFSKSVAGTFSSVGENLTYTFNVTNDGNVTLSSLTVTDPAIPSLSCTFTNLAPTVSDSCTGTYVVKQADVDAGTIVNNASATGQSPQGTQVIETATATSNRTPTPSDRQFTVMKSANVTQFTTVGQDIFYAIDVRNTGLQTIEDITVTDILDPSFSCTISSIAPGQGNDQCSFVYRVTQDDVDAGSISNTASAVNADFGPITDTLVINGPSRVASFTTTKIALNNYNVSGDSVTYRVSVTNTGNVRINGVSVSDRGQTCTSVGTLEPGETDNSCEFTFTVDQADVDAGEINNTATTTGTGADTTALSSDASTTANGPAEMASLTAVKVEDDGTGDFSALPTTEDYTITVQNTGNVTVNNISVVDDLIGLNCTIATLLPGATATNCSTGAMSGTYTVTQSDIDTGSLSNTVQVSGTTPEGTIVEDETEVVIAGPTQTRALETQKSSSIPTGTLTEVGQAINYSYQVFNRGNVTHTAPISVTDDRIASVSCPALPAAGLAPDASITCTATYLVDQDDLDNGSVTNIASATSTLGNGTVVTSPTDSVTVNTTQNPAMTVDKRLAASSAGTFDTVGDLITYEYFVTNTGNTTITETIRIDDDRFGSDLVCTTSDIAPNGTALCQQTYSITQTDLNDGFVTNTAQAFTGPNLGASTLSSPADQVTVTAMQNPVLFIDKTIILSGTETFTDGQVLNYSYLVRNDGNVEIGINPANVVQDNRTTVDCSGAPATLTPGASFTCSATGTVNPSDIAVGALSNTAFAQGTFDGNPIQSPTDLQTFPVDVDPALAISKSTTATTFTTVGELIPYTYEVTNTGNTDLNAPLLVTDDQIPGNLSCPDPDGGVFVRIVDDPTEIATCTQNYSVTQADLDRGFITNIAEANTTFGSGVNEIPVVSETDTVTVTGNVTAELELLKTVSPTTPPELNDVLTYTLTASASGNQTISGAEISDPLLPSLTCTQSGGAVTTADLDPNGDPLICTGTLTVTQQMIDDGVVTNTASVRGSAPDGTVIMDDVTNNLTTEAPDPELTVTKTINPPPATGTDPSYATIDQTVQFVISVENTGNVTVSGISVADLPTSTNGATPASCSIGALAPGETNASCVFEVVTTQAEIDAGSFDNTATASGTPANGGTVTDSDTINVLGPLREREFSMSKVATTTSFENAGDVISYTFTVGNTGNVTLFDQPVIVDDKIGTFNCGTIPAGGLLPTEAVTCTADYPVDQDDVDAGFVTNNASVTSTEVPTPATATETVNTDREPSLTFTKTPSTTSDAKAGDEITYTYRVTNTGNTRLFNVMVADDQTSSAGTSALTISGDTLAQDNGATGDSPDGAGDGIWGTLAPGDVVTFTSSYTVTQADIDDGTALSNTATVNATGPPGTTPPTDTETVTVPLEAKNSELTVLKTITNSTGINAGDTVTFRVEVDNSGNLTLDLPILTDTLRRLDGSTVSPAPTLSSPTGNTSDLSHLNVDETFVYTFTHTLTQADVDAGGISNSVLARADDPDGNTVSDTSGNGQPGGDNAPTVQQIPAMPAISSEKTISTSGNEVGQTVVFKITATNEGNVTLNSVTVSDTLTRADGTSLSLQSGPTFTTATSGSSAGTLIPGETATYVAAYTLVQADIDAGGISNQATAFGTPPVGGAISDDSDDGDDSDGNTTNDPTVLEIEADPELSLRKQLAASEPGNFDTLGQEISFEFVVTNEGNVTLDGPFTISDPLIESSNDDLSCPSGSIAPGETLTCTGTYTVTQGDLDAGSITNTATVSDGITTSPSDDLTIPAIQNPSMAVVKTAREVLPEDFDVGLEVTYDYVVTNDGNITVDDPITINDNLIPSVTCEAFPSNGLAPGASYACTGTYTVTADDVDVREVTNIASASDGTTTSPLVSETIPDTASPSLSITKTADPGSTFDEVGDVINYTFEVTNDGTQAFAAEVRVFDTKIGDETGLVCFTPSGANPSLSVGETVSCSFSYSVTQEDLDAGEVINEAFAQTSFGGGSTPVSSAPTSETVTADLDPMMSLTKTSAPNPAGGVGTTVSYTFIATNTGNQTLNTVKVTDPRIPSLDCEVAELERGDSLTCSADYTVTQADIDAGTLVNTASVNAMTPQGTSTPTTQSSVTTGVPASVPGVTLDKIPSQTVFGEAGSFVTFLFDVRNTGNTTLSNVTIDDVLDTGAPCVIPTLAPGAIDNFSCTFMMEVTQEMVDTATVTNSATASATDPFGTDVTATDSETLAGPPRNPQLETTKVVLSGDKTLFSPITYALQVENTGNVTLTAPVITDTMTRIGTGASVSLNQPFALTSGDIDGDGLLDVGETWVYQAIKTITQGDINAGGLSNTASATADGPTGTGITTDQSDNGNDSDGNTTDDPTLFEITSEPEITTIKSVASSTGSSAGDTVVFTIIARNTGNVDVSGVTISDTLMRADGTPLSSPAVTNVTGSTTLGVGAEIEWRVEHTLTQEDVNAGGLSNSAEVSGLAPDGGVVTDTSANDNPFDGNTEDDGTIFNILPDPSLDVLKVQSIETVVPGEQLGFTITSLNDGNVSLTGLVLADTLTRFDGTVLTVDSIVYNGADAGSSEGTLLPGESSTHTVLYTIVQADIDAGGVQNTATLSGTAPNGAALMDRSRDGDPSDGNNVDDPTLVSLLPTQSTELTKAVSEPIALFPQVYQVTFTLTVKNDGNLPTTGLQVIDDLTDFKGTAEIVREDPFVFATRVTGLPGGAVNPNYDGETDTNLLDGTADLAPGQTAVIEIDLVYTLEFGGATGGNIFSSTSDQQPAPTVSNEVVITGGDTDGDGIPDNLEACGSSDRDGDGICDAEDFDPTGYFYCEDNGQILAGGQISVQGPLGTQVGVGSSNNITIVRDGADGQFIFFVSRPGTYRLLASYPPSGEPSTTRLSSGALDATSLLPANPASLGSGEFGTTRRLGDFSSGANTFYTTFTFEAGDPFIINNNLPMQNCASAAGIFASKTADRSSAVFGETVNFTLSFVNNTSSDLTDATFTDLLPPGMLYTPGSAQVNGVSTEPTVTGLTLEWPGQTIPANNTVRVTLAARVVANGTYGELVNRAYVTDAAGAILSNIATATVRVEPEHVFDCADIIGKVFDDKNHNGYHDEGEPGLPGVRLATVNGVLITTDKHGRYHVPCAELPQDIGSNFLLKLDTRTLPTGYRVTTENPRVIRVTAGKFAKLNFGASLSNVIDIDLTSAAFVAGKDTPTEKLEKGVAHLISRIRSTPSVLRISYILRGEEDRQTANARLKAVEKLVRERWRGAGRYKLNVERSIKRVQ